MRPSSLRRYGIAVVASGLLLASGAVPGFASDIAEAEDTPRDRVTSGAEVGLGSWLCDLLAEHAGSVQNALIDALSWSHKVLVPTIAPVPVPVQPLGVIVDDGAPF